jgi:hypothetical protein
LKILTEDILDSDRQLLFALASRKHFDSI